MGNKTNMNKKNLKHDNRIAIGRYITGIYGLQYDSFTLFVTIQFTRRAILSKSPYTRITHSQQRRARTHTHTYI